MTPTGKDPWPFAARLCCCAVFAAATLLAALGLRTVILGDSLASRLATVYALAHDGTWSIARPADQPPNPFEPLTVDKVEIGGHRYSSKPPVFPLLMTAEYWGLRKVFGWSLDQRSQWRVIVQWMTVPFVSLPYLAGLVWFALLLGWYVENSWRALALLAALAFGSQYAGYAANVNNHVPAAALLIAAMYVALGLLSGNLSPAPWRFAVFGLAAAMVFTFDLPSAVFAATLGLALAVRFPKQAFSWCVLGALPPLAVHFGIMSVLTGSLLPVQVNRSHYLFESSVWRNPLGIDALDEPKPYYLFHLMLGRHGTFLLFPVLLLGLAGTVQTAFRASVFERRAVWSGCAAFAILTAYYTLHTDNYGGAAYGFRWHIPAIPVLLLLAVPWVNRARARNFWLFYVLAMAVSVYSAYECLSNPWTADAEWTCRWLFGNSY